MKKSQAGFSLVEAAVVVLIGGILLGTFSTMLLNYIQEANVTTTQSRIAAIDAALGQYYINNGAYPCPASLTAAMDTAAYGVQQTTDCYGESAPDAGTFRIPASSLTFVPPQFTTTYTSAPYTAPFPSASIRIGAVPVRTLNLPDQYINDAWNDRFYYAVTEVLASPTNASTVPLFNTNGGAISVVDSMGNNVAQPPGTAQYIIISSGQNCVDAYTVDGVKAIACNTATLEGKNCLNTSSKGVFTKTLLTGENTSSSSMFDDFVTFHVTAAQGAVLSGLIAPFYSSTASCPSGWITPNLALTSVLTTLPASYI